MLKLNRWDSALHLQTKQDVALYLDACLAECGTDAAFIAKALGNVARSYGMTQIAAETGLGRESHYEALSGDGNPSFETILRVIHSLGMELRVTEKGA